MTLRQLAFLALLAVIPVLAFVVGRGAPIVVLAAVNAGIVAASLYAMWGPSEQGNGQTVIHG